MRPSNILPLLAVSISCIFCTLDVAQENIQEPPKRFNMLMDLLPPLELTPQSEQETQEIQETRAADNHVGIAEDVGVNSSKVEIRSTIVEGESDQLLNDISAQSNPDDSQKILKSDIKGSEMLEKMLNSPEFKDILSGDRELLASAQKLRFNTGPKDLHTKERCFIVSLHDTTPPHIIEKINKVFQSPPLKGNLTGLFEKVFKGVTVCFDDDSHNDEDDYTFPYLHLFEKIPWINVIERDHRISACQVQTNAPWGLSRISKKNLPVNWEYPFDKTGEGICAYVIDSGVQANHPEFGGRVHPVYSAFGPPERSGSDFAGHGTEVASALAGTNLGVAKKATIKSVQILADDGLGKNSDLIRGLEWVATHMQQPAVINLSLGGPKSTVLDAAVKKILGMNVPVVVAAGNYRKDACSLSPCSVEGCIAVGSTGPQDSRSSFSNYGSCVDIFAPGENIMVAVSGPKSTTGRPSVRGYSTSGGTSLSAPYVAGVAALLLQSNPSMSSKEVWDQIYKNSAKDVLDQDSLRGSPNVLLQIPPVTDLSSKLVVFSSSIPNPRFFDPDNNETWGAISDVNQTGGDSWEMSSTTWIILGASIGGAILLALGTVFLVRSIMASRRARRSLRNTREGRNAGGKPSTSNTHSSPLQSQRVV